MSCSFSEKETTSFNLSHFIWDFWIALYRHFMCLRLLLYFIWFLLIQTTLGLVRFAWKETIQLELQNQQLCVK